MLEIDAVVTTERLADDIGLIALHRAPANALGLPLIEGLDVALDELCDTKVIRRGTRRLPRLIGRGRALDLMLTGREVAAEEAVGVGLLDRLVDDAEGHALALPAELRALSQPALHAVVRSVNVADEHPLGQGLTRERREERQLFEHGEAREGIAAFLEKRAPRFA